MQRYANLSGHSGVVAYEFDADSITIKFAGGDRYLYTKDSAGAAHIVRMCELAESGRGLTTYISQHVRDRYAKKSS